MTVTTDHAERQHVDQLRELLRGRLVVPGDADYDALRQVMMGALDPRPALIALVGDATDVARVIAYARDSGLPLAVRSGGHSGAGHSTVDGGIVLDLRDMKAIDIDPHARTAWAEAGLTAAEYIAAADAHGLATGFGDTGSVGIGGITLGGGIGYLSRKFGLTIDSLLAAELVTAQGELLHVDEEKHPDLFWALRGGGGNFGVATRFKFRLHPLEQVVGGMLLLPATAQTVEGFVALSQAAPDELTTIANVMNCPPMPFVPEEWHGRVVIMGMLCYAGETEAAQAALAPFRALAQPIADMLAPMPYSGMFPPEDGDYRPTAVSRNMFMDHVGPAEAETIVDRLNASDAPLRAVQLRVHGGAIARVPAQATAFAHRSAPIMVNVAAFYEGEEDEAPRQAWVDEVVASLRQGVEGAYVNFVGDEGEQGVESAYPPQTRHRLSHVKARYEPDNFFRRNQNVPPAA